MINTLIVDDSAEILEVLSLNLKLHPKLEVIRTAQSIQEAIQVCGTTNVDLISIDIHLGKESGFELCKEIRRTYPQIFITMCSMEYDPEYMDYATQCGANYFLPKPVSMDDLNSLVQEYSIFSETLKTSHNESIDLLQLLNMAKSL